MKTFGIVFLFALIVRLLALAYFLPKLNPEVDLDSYRSLARNLAHGRGFVAAGPEGEVLPQVDRTPLYPFFLAGLMRVGGDRLGLFLAAQCILGAATCALTTVLAARWLPQPAALTAGILLALDPNSIVRCVDLRTETLFTLLIVAGACVLAWRSERAVMWLIAGLIWSLAAFCRPIAIGLWMAALLVAGIQRQRWVCAAAFAAGFVPLILLWSARNSTLTGRWFYSTAATYNLYVVRASGVEAERLGMNHNEMQDRFASRFLHVQFFKSRHTFETALRDCRRASREILTSSPGIAAKQFALGWFKVLLGLGARSLDNSLRQPSAPARFWPALYGVALALMTAAAIIGAWRLGRPAVLLPVLAVYFVLLSGGGGGNSRFRVPVTPMLSVLAVAAWRKPQ